MQGAVYNAIDIKTGRRVVIKTACKQLVHRHLSRQGTFIREDIRKEAKILKNISRKKHCDSGKF